MAVWTPRPLVTVKVVGLAWRGDELLLGEVEDSAGRVKGLRPLGGHIEFGETRENALAREFAEELGCGIALAGPWHAFENLYEHEGATGHEFIFAANVTLADGELYRRDRIGFHEDQGLPCFAVWQSPASLPPGLELYPSGLLSMIEDGVISPSG
jgi:ADP-ribose pyrophosphatase YjhB (NUDIX family)